MLKKIFLGYPPVASKQLFCEGAKWVDLAHILIFLCGYVVVPLCGRLTNNSACISAWAKRESRLLRGNAAALKEEKRRKLFDHDSDATVRGLSSTGFEHLLLINFRPRHSSITHLKVR